MNKMLDDQLVQECFNTKSLFELTELLKKEYSPQLIKSCLESMLGEGWQEIAVNLLQDDKEKVDKLFLIISKD